MAVDFNHTIIHARDRQKSAAILRKKWSGKLMSSMAVAEFTSKIRQGTSWRSTRGRTSTTDVGFSSGRSSE